MKKKDLPSVSLQCRSWNLLISQSFYGEKIEIKIKNQSKLSLFYWFSSTGKEPPFFVDFLFLPFHFPNQSSHLHFHYQPFQDTPLSWSLWPPHPTTRSWFMEENFCSKRCFLPTLIRSFPVILTVLSFHHFIIHHLSWGNTIYFFFPPLFLNFGILYVFTMHA